MNRHELLANFVARVYDLTGAMPDQSDLRGFNDPGWVHIIQRRPGHEGSHRARSGWCTVEKLPVHLPRMIKEPWKD